MSGDATTDTPGAPTVPSDPMAAIPGHLCPKSRATYAVFVRNTNEARAKLREAYDAFSAAKADVFACQRGEAGALAALVEERLAASEEPQP